MRITWWQAWLLVAVFSVLAGGLWFFSEWLGDRRLGDDYMIFRVLADVLAIVAFVCFIIAVILSVASL